MLAGMTMHKSRRDDLLAAVEEVHFGERMLLLKIHFETQAGRPPTPEMRHVAKILRMAVLRLIEETVIPPRQKKAA